MNFRDRQEVRCIGDLKLDKTTNNEIAWINNRSFVDKEFAKQAENRPRFLQALLKNMVESPIDIRWRWRGA